MSDNVDRAESAKGTRDNLGHFAGASPVCFFATANPIDVPCTPVYPVTFTIVTIQFCSCEVRLYVFTTLYACYAFAHDTITYTRPSVEIANTFCSVAYSVNSVSCTDSTILYTGSSNASCDTWTNLSASTNTCTASHPSQAA